jgi:hypothetical protein
MTDQCIEMRDNIDPSRPSIPQFSDGIVLMLLKLMLLAPRLLLSRHRAGSFSVHIDRWSPQNHEQNSKASRFPLPIAVLEAMLPIRSLSMNDHSNFEWI